MRRDHSLASFGRSMVYVCHERNNFPIDSQGQTWINDIFSSAADAATLQHCNPMKTTTKHGINWNHFEKFRSMSIHRIKTQRFGKMTTLGTKGQSALDLKASDFRPHVQ